MCTKKDEGEGRALLHLLLQIMVVVVRMVVVIPYAKNRQMSTD